MMTTHTPLTGVYIQRLQAALLDSFDLESLRRMVRTNLDEELERIVPVEGQTLTDIVYDLIRAYAARSEIHKLVAAARAANPGNQALAQIEADLAGISFEPLPLPEPHAPMDATPSSRLPGKRTLWVATAACIGLLAVAGLGWVYGPSLVERWNGPACAGSQFCAVVARLTAPDAAQSDELTTEIAQQIRDVLGNEDANQSRVAIVPSVDDEAAAGKVADRQGALLAVWGRVLQQAGGKLRVQFELANLLGVDESHTLRTLRAEPLLYDPIAGRVICANCFDVAEGELGQRIAIVAHAAAGLMHYAGRPEQAYKDFMAALYCAGETIAPELQAALRPVCTQRKPLADWNPALLHYYAGKAAVLSGNYAAGIELLRTAAADNLYDPAAPLGIGAAYQAWTGDPATPQASAGFAEAAARIKNLLLTVPADDVQATLYHDLGLVYELQANWPRAVDNYRKAVELFGATQPAAYVSLVRLGAVLGQSGDVASAEARLQQALALDPKAPWAYLELADLAWTGKQDRSAAERWLAQADAATPNPADVAVARGELCAAWGDAACAAQAFASALVARPRSGWLHGRVGAFYLPTNPVQAGQSWDKAAEQYAWAVDLRPHDPWAHERLAYVLLNQGQAADAAEHYARAIALTAPDLTPGRLYCGLALAQQRDGQADAAQASQTECDQKGRGAVVEGM